MKIFASTYGTMIDCRQGSTAGKVRAYLLSQGYIPTEVKDYLYVLKWAKPKGALVYKYQIIVHPRPAQEHLDYIRRNIIDPVEWTFYA